MADDQKLIPGIPNWIWIGAGAGVLLVLFVSSRGGGSPVGTAETTAPVVAAITQGNEQLHSELTAFEAEMSRRMDEQRQMWQTTQQALSSLAWR